MIWWIILVLIGVYVVGLLADVRLIYYYEHPEDSQYTQGLFAKVIAVLGMQIVWLINTGLPTDAFNTYFKGGLDMFYFWLIAILVVVVYLVLPLPYAYFLYEADSDVRLQKRPGWQKALCKTAIVVVVVGICLGVTYPFLNKAKIDINVIECSSFSDISSNARESSHCTSRVGQMEAATTFTSYLCGVSAFVGYLFFSLFTGVGLVSLPFSLIYGFIDRPMPITLDEFKVRKRVLAERAGVLRESGDALKRQELKVRGAGGLDGWRQKANLNRGMKKFRQSVYLLEKDFEHVNKSLKDRGENPFFAYLKLSMGILCAIVSMIWFLHIVMFTGLNLFIPEVPGILNTFLIALRSTETFFLDLFFCSMLLFYLLICAVQGCFKFGMRIFIGFPIHPVKKANMRSNTILFNVVLLLLTSCAMTHFSYISFRDYASGTELDFIYGGQFSHLVFFDIVFGYGIFTWVLCGMSVLSVIFFAIRPRDRPAVDEAFAKRMQEELKTLPLAEGDGDGGDCLLEKPEDSS